MRAGRPDAAWRAAGAAAGATGSTAGRRRVNSAPPPGRSPTSIVPPWALTMPWQTESPIPVPAPGGLVVKNGSKIRLRSSGGDAGAVVRDLELDPAVPLASRQHEPARRRHVAQRLLGVDDEVEEHLVELVGVAPRPAAGRAASSRTDLTPAVRRP